MPRTNSRKQKTPVKNAWANKSRKLKVIRPAYGNTVAVRATRSIFSNQVFPNKYRFDSCLTMQGYIPVASVNSGYGNYMSVNVNSYLNPFATTYRFTNAANVPVGFTAAFRGTLQTGFTIGQNPYGYSVIAQIWEYYKVYKYEIEVCVQPEATADVCRLVVLPLGQEEIPSVSTTNLNVLECQEYAQAKTCAANSSSSGNTIKFVGYPNRDLGLTYTQYSIGQNPLSGAPGTSTSDYVGILVNELFSTNSQALIVSIKLRQYVECTGLLGFTS